MKDMKPLHISHNPFFSLLLLAASFSLQASSSSLTGSFKDTQQLLNVKATLPNSTLLPNWLPNQNPCNFTGVSCKDDTLVSSLDLSYTPLDSDLRSVSSFLLTLDQLESLSLKSTNLTGTVSAFSASRCGALLLDVDLSSNALEGSLTDLSSFTSTSCSSLKSLNLSANSLDFSNTNSTGLQLNSIESLDFSKKVTGNIPISNCKSLEFLDLSSNNFSTEIPSFGDCLSLQHLDISSNKFHGEIGNALVACQRLALLDLSSNQFSGPIPSVPTGKLQYLSLSGNDFQGGIPLGIADACLKLLHLDLSYNNLSGSVPSNLGTCSSLEYINLSRNEFSGGLPIETLIKMSNLKKLVLSYNSFIGGLPDSLSKMTNLESLDVSSNNFSGLIPSGLCQGPKNSLKETVSSEQSVHGSYSRECWKLLSAHFARFELQFPRGDNPGEIGFLVEPSRFDNVVESPPRRDSTRGHEHPNIREFDSGLQRFDRNHSVWVKALHQFEMDLIVK
ncbi:hypothetical protein L1049_000480 [Liquidambar formosana]|uniref:Leucine-rich repeat-containing N-terminal plant-type domain-containing protein n=1 Tax=Liquidambar formosana TaxID=63359 RepID=A0AAP0NCE3_LIQFO